MVTATALSSLGKGKSVLREPSEVSPQSQSSGTSESSSDDEGSESSSGSESDSASDFDSDEEIGQEFLDSLLEKARRNAALKAQENEDERDSLVNEGREEEEIRLDSEEKTRCVRN